MGRRRQRPQGARFIVSQEKLLAETRSGIMSAFSKTPIKVAMCAPRSRRSRRRLGATSRSRQVRRVQVEDAVGEAIELIASIEQITLQTR